MTPINREQILSELPTHIEAVVARDKVDFPTFYVGGFRSGPVVPRPLTGVFIEALSYEIKRPDQALYSNLDSSLRKHTGARSMTTVALATMRRDDMGSSLIPVKLCADAEPYFDSAYRQILDNPTSTSAPHKQLSVYHDQHGDPVMVRKNLEASTAITTQAILDERTGITMPVGTIIGMSRVRDKFVTGESVHRRDGHATRLRTVEFDPQSEPVLPLRLSAWAFSEFIDQATFAATGSSKAYDINERRLDTIHGRSVDDFRTLGREILDICGV